MDHIANSHSDEYPFGLDFASRISLLGVPTLLTIGAAKSLYEAWNEPACWNGHLPTYELAKRIALGAEAGGLLGAGISATGSLIIAVDRLLKSSPS